MALRRGPKEIHIREGTRSGLQVVHALEPSNPVKGGETSTRIELTGSSDVGLGESDFEGPAECII